MSLFKTNLAGGTYVELLRSCFETVLPTTIMAFSFFGVGTLVSFQHDDPTLIALTSAGAGAILARLCILFVYRKRAADETCTVAQARLYERIYAVPYLLFATMLGSFCARAFFVVSPQTLTLVIGLLFGYGGSVAAGLSLRPWISVPSIFLSVVPALVAAWLTGDPMYRAVGALLAVFLGGGIHSMVTRYKLTAQRIDMRRLFATLARSDALTGLPNRLSLRERFEKLAASPRKPTFAVHCLDLDRFKPVNDLHGHPVGDALLQAVAGRLSEQLRASDFAARVGGDEFVVVQGPIAQPGEADLLARRIVRAVSQPYLIEGHEISIGMSIGYALSSDYGLDVDRPIVHADDGLNAVKRGGGGGCQQRAAPNGPDTAAAAG